MIAYIVGAFVAVPAVIAAIAVTTRPDTFRCERSIVVDAAPEAIFPLVNVVRNGEKWGPWYGLDPKMKTEYSGPESGEGACYSWDGDKNVGSGRCTTLETRGTELVRQKLEFFRPFSGVNTVDFTFKPEGPGKTRVTWAMYGPNKFMGKVMSLFMDCDKMCGEMFIKGLEKIKALAEGKAA